MRTYGVKGSFSNTIDVDVIKRYNEEIAKTSNGITAYYRALSDGNGNIIQCNKATRDLIASQNGAAVSTEALKQAQDAASKSGSKLTGIMKTLKGALINFGIMLAIEGIIALVKFTQETFFPTVKQLKEELSETTQEIADLHSEQESLNSELETTRQRIAELKAQGTLTFTEEAELTRLQKENAELERKLELTKANKAASESEFEGNFLDAFNSDYGDKATFNYQGRRNWLDKLADALLEGSETRFTAEEYTSDLFASYEKALSGDKAYEHNLDKYKERINDVYEDYQGYLKQLEDADYSYGTNEQIDAYIDQINEFNDKYLVAFGNTENLFAQIVSRDKFADGYAAITELGNVTQETLSKLYNENEKVRELINYLMGLGTVDWKSILGEDRFNELDSDKSGTLTTLELFDEKTGECKVTSEQFSQAMSGVANELNKVEEAAESTLFKIQSLTDSFSELEKISDKFSKLGSAISELKENGYVSIKTINEIAEAFKGTEGLDNYISQIATASNTAQLQNSIQGLINSYLNQESVLKGLDDANKQVLITQLQRLGVTNAEEVVNAKINQNLPGLTQNMKDFSKMTANEASSLYALAKGANVAATELEKYAQIVEKVGEIERLQAEMNKFYDSGQYGPSIYEWKIAQIRKDIAKIVDSIDTSSMDTDVKIKISMSGLEDLSGSGKTAEEKRKEAIEKQKEKAEAEIAKLKYKLETNKITEEQYLKDLDYAYKSFYNKTADYLEDYAKYSQEVYDGFKDMYKEDLEAQKEAWEEKKDAVSEYYDNLREQIEDAHDEEDYEKEQSEKRKEIFDLDMQIAELMRDGSEKAKARIAELEEERLKAEEELLDFETDKARENELSRLEKEQKAEEKKIQDKIDGIQGQLDKLDEDTISVRNAIISYARAKGVTLDFAYASGTRSSVGGFGRINEKGIEMISAPDGNGNYIPMLPNSYVFSAKATEFLWKLATEHSLPQAMYNSIAKSIKTQSSTPSVNIAQPITITMGDVIIKGNADKQTVADIKKQQENTVRMVLQKIKELQK